MALTSILAGMRTIIHFFNKNTLMDQQFQKNAVKPQKITFSKQPSADAGLIGHDKQLKIFLQFSESVNRTWNKLKTIQGRNITGIFVDGAVTIKKNRPPHLTYPAPILLRWARLKTVKVTK